MREFAGIDRDDVQRLFSELCFCICTPQTRARAAHRAVKRLEESQLLWHGDKSQISQLLASEGVRFPNVKAGYIVASRARASSLPTYVRAGDGKSIRKTLMSCFPGLGMKEASHFLRNIGFIDVAILDRHVLRWMVRVGVIKRPPRSLTARRYMILERKFYRLSEIAGIPPAALDLVMWSAETGEVFK